MTQKSELLKVMSFFGRVSLFLAVLILTQELREGTCSSPAGLFASLALAGLFPQSPCGISDNHKCLYKSLGQRGEGGREVGSDVKYQIAAELHVDVELSCHPRAFVSSLLKFKFVHKEAARQTSLPSLAGAASP